jgi:DNA-binding transcriptional MerR regulator
MSLHGNEDPPPHVSFQNRMINIPTYTTSQLADAAEVGSQTLRYYERRGLLPEPPRTRGGHRLYGPQHLERLLFIQKVQCLGFQLEEIHELLKVEERPAAPSDAAETLARFIGRIDQKAFALSEMRESLAKLRRQAEVELAEGSTEA